MSIENFKEYVGYGRCWDLFLDSGFYRRQYDEYIKRGDQDKEHYKWSAYSYIIENYDLTDSPTWRKFVNVVNHDDNEHLYKGAISRLLENGILTVSALKSCDSTRIKSFKKVIEFIEENK